jgi:toxin HigB-1
LYFGVPGTTSKFGLPTEFAYRRHTTVGIIFFGQQSKSLGGIVNRGGHVPPGMARNPNFSVTNTTDLLGCASVTIAPCHSLCYCRSQIVIRSFRHKGLKRLFENGENKGVRADHVNKVENILAVLNRARKPEDMNLPGFRLHRLKGDLKDFWSVTVRANWRVIFRFDQGDAYDVDYIDYH